MNDQTKQSRQPWWRKKKRSVTEPAAKPKANYAFIDSQNLNLGVQKAGWKMDWRKFREWLRTEYNVTHAYMFIGYMQENEQLYEQMYEHGFLVVLKPTVDISAAKRGGEPDKKQATQTGERHKNEVKTAAGKDGKDEKPGVKGNIDADLVLYAMKELPHYDKAVIVSGDGDFFGLVEYLAGRGKLLKVLAPNWQYSSLLKGFDTYITDLHAHRSQLAYRDFKRRTRPPHQSQNAKKRGRAA